MGMAHNQRKDGAMREYWNVDGEGRVTVTTPTRVSTCTAAGSCDRCRHYKQMAERGIARSGVVVR